MKKVLFLMFVCSLVAVPLAASQGSVQLIINGNITPYSSISMPEPSTFWILDEDDNLIPSKHVGDPLVIANWRAWKVKVDSLYKLDMEQGRLKLDGSEVYIPYRFALYDGAEVIASRFNDPSVSLPRTAVAGRPLSLYFYFSDDDTRWPAGIYRDTLVFSLIAD